MSRSNRADLQRFLDRLTSRSVLSEEEQQAILDLPCRAEHVQSNRDFVWPGKRVDHACLIATGLVGRFEENADGKRQITALHIPGDMADLHSVVQPVASSALQALSVTRIVRVPHAALRAAAERYPPLAEALWRDCMADAAVLSQWVVNVGRRDARMRIAHLLCEMAVRLQVAPAEGEIAFPFAVTQQQLADATGLTSVHINRSLQAMRGDKLADIRGGVARIPDWAALVEEGGFDAGYLHRSGRPAERLRIVEAVGQ